MKNLELKVPPDIALLATAVGMWAATRIVSSFSLPFAARVITGSVLAVFGLSIVQAAGFSFRKVRTTVDPARPDLTSTLVETGIYLFTQNPIYLGMTIVLLGWAVFLLNLLSLALVAAFMAYITRFQIIPEERALSAHFGKKYSFYCSRVRRWI